MEGKTITKGVGSVFKTIGFVLMTFMLIGITTAAICGMVFAVYINKYITPTLDIDLDSYRLNQTSFIYALDPETGKEVQIEHLYALENRVWVGIKEIPKQLQLAFISVEDNRFYSHHGVDWKRTIGAALNFVLHFKGEFGGSTITQQLIKNLTGEDETSVERKIQEIMRSLEVEKNYEKEDILELYLNTIYFGQGAYGVKQAAQIYFNKELNQLSLAECAALAGITKNPYKNDLKRYPENNAERRATVLYTMYDEGNITREEYERALAEDVKAIRNTDEDDDDTSYQSYYVDAVIDEVINDLCSTYGYSKNVATKLLYNGGLKIVIPIDLEIQAAMDQVFQDLENFPGDLGNDGTFPQAAMTLMNPYTGEVLAMYGGRGVKYGDRVNNRAVSAYRQPGSAIKPLTVYTPAIEYGGLLPISVLDDAPFDFITRAGGEGGWPLNENRRWSGLCTVYTGIAKSYNTIAVAVLENYVGVGQSYIYAKTKFGLNLVDEKKVENKEGETTVFTDIAAAPLALGGLTTGVTTLEMTAAYSAFVNNGTYTKPIIYTIVYDNEGNVLLDNSKPVTVEAMNPKTRDYMIELLTHVVNGQGGTGAKAKIDGIEVGGKTGTTSSDNDRWFAGITPYYAGVVWFGYDTPQSLQKFSTNPSLELWTRVMTAVHENLEPRKFEDMLDNYVTVSYCLDSGLIPTEWCLNDVRGARVASGLVHADDAPTKECNVHVAVLFDGTTDKVANEYCPAESLYSVGAILVERAYPIAGVSITDASFTAPYTISIAKQEAGLLYQPINGGLALCTDHNHENNANKPVEPDPVDPDPVEPEPDPDPVEPDPANPNTSTPDSNDLQTGYPEQDGDDPPSIDG